MKDGMKNEWKRIKRLLAAAAAAVMTVTGAAIPAAEPALAADSRTEAINRACAWAINICNDDRHGYGTQGNIDGPDYACTTLIAGAYTYAGVPFTTDYTCADWDKVLPKFNFYRVDFNADTDYELERGDIVWNGHHVELYIGNGQLASANSNRGYPQEGDQTTTEVHVHDYYSSANGRWICAFRLEGEVPNDDPIAPYPRPTGEIGRGTKNRYVGWIQYTLQFLGYDIGSWGIDLDYGGDTELAVRRYQADHGLDADGIVGPITVASIVEEVMKKLEPDGPILSEGAGRTLPDGDYFIYSNLKLNYYLDISGTASPAAPGTNVHMWTATRLPKEADGIDAWTLKYLGNGFYKIMQKGTNLCLDVQGASRKRGCNIDVWSEHSDASEQWSIKPTATGYTIQARCGGFYLDICNAATENGTNVEVWDLDDGISQRWAFVPFAPSVSQTVPDGVYSIQSAVDPSFGLDVQGYYNTEYKNEVNVQLWPVADCNDTFRVTYLGDGYYSICEAVSGLALDIADKGAPGYLNTGNNIQLYSKNLTPNQQYIIKDAGGGYFYIISAYSGYCVDLSGGQAVNRGNISQYYFNGTNAQRWRFAAPILKPETSILKADKAEVFTGETVSFAAESDSATGYTIGVDLDGKRLITEAMPDGKLELSFAEAGTYSAYVTAYNAMGYADSARITFTVKPYALTMYETEQHTISIKGSYRSSDPDVALVSKSGVITAMGKGSAIVTVTAADGTQTQILVQVLRAAIPGDCTGDGLFDIEDIDALRGWLTSSDSGNIVRWENADLNGDGRLNAVDLTLMKRRLIRLQ